MPQRTRKAKRIAGYKRVLRQYSVLGYSYVAAVHFVPRLWKTTDRREPGGFYCQRPIELNYANLNRERYVGTLLVSPLLPEPSKTFLDYVYSGVLDGEPLTDQTASGSAMAQLDTQMSLYATHNDEPIDYSDPAVRGAIHSSIFAGSDDTNPCPHGVDLFSEEFCLKCDEHEARIEGWHRDPERALLEWMGAKVVGAPRADDRQSAAEDDAEADRCAADELAEIDAAQELLDDIEQRGETQPDGFIRVSPEPEEDNVRELIPTTDERSVVEIETEPGENLVKATVHGVPEKLPDTSTAMVNALRWFRGDDLANPPATNTTDACVRRGLLEDATIPGHPLRLTPLGVAVLQRKGFSA